MSNNPKNNDPKNNEPVKNANEEENKDASVKPDPETLHTPDPQEHMEGPISSLMHKTGEAFDTNESKEEADEKKEENM